MSGISFFLTVILFSLHADENDGSIIKDSYVALQCRLPQNVEEDLDYESFRNVQDAFCVKLLFPVFQTHQACPYTFNIRCKSEGNDLSFECDDESNVEVIAWRLVNVNGSEEDVETVLGLASEGGLC